MDFSFIQQLPDAALLSTAMNGTQVIFPSDTIDSLNNIQAAVEKELDWRNSLKK